MSSKSNNNSSCKFIYPLWCNLYELNKQTFCKCDDGLGSWMKDIFLNNSIEHINTREKWKFWNRKRDSNQKNIESSTFNIQISSVLPWLANARFLLELANSRFLLALGAFCSMDVGECRKLFEAALADNWKMNHA